MLTIFSENELDDKINDYLDNNIKNPILKKVIEEEFIYSNNVENIIKKYFSDIVLNVNYDKLKTLSQLIKNVSQDNLNFLTNKLCSSFIGLSSDEHLFLIIGINQEIQNIIQLMSNSIQISNILKYLISGLSIGISSEYMIKYIDSCNLINNNISTEIVQNYIHENGSQIITNDKLLAYFIKYISANMGKFTPTHINGLLNVKLSSINTHLNTLTLDKMDYAYEIYKLGSIIIDSNLLYDNEYFKLDVLNFTDDQLEYIVKSIHTCLIKKNNSQAKSILAIIYYMTKTQLSKFVTYYNKYFTSRIKDMKYSEENDIISIEYHLWNINFEYKKIISDTSLSSYKQIINNIKYSNLINDELSKINIKNSDVIMKKIKVNIETDIEMNFQEVTHHKIIQDYISGLNKYIDVRMTLQNIFISMDQSNIKLKTKQGSIYCSLVLGSCLLYLEENKEIGMKIPELMKKMNMNETNLKNILETLLMNDIINVNEDNTIYKYIEPFGYVDCTIHKVNNKETNEVVINKFTDIIMTIDSRIIKEIKPEKMNIMELERRVQEFMGESYVRNIFYQRLDSLKNRFFINEVDSIVEYVV
jgi:hypothetical protein